MSKDEDVLSKVGISGVTSGVVLLEAGGASRHGLQCEKYFMVNAAVPVEAYDPVGGVTEASRAILTPSAWIGYPQRLRTAGWYDLAPEGGRAGARPPLQWYESRIFDILSLHEQ